MNYHIARNGQTYGPYTDAQVRQYLQSGNILLTDLAQPEGSTEWALVGAIFAAYVAQSGGMPALAQAGAASTMAHAVAVPTMASPALFPDPPDLPWWLALLLGIATGGFFFVIWDVVEASWLRRVERGSSALLLYAVAAVLYLFKLPGMWATVRYNAFGGPAVYEHLPGLGLAGLILIVVARFVFRRELLGHFNGPEPLGLHLNAFWTLLFGGLYFQFKFNRINERKRELRISRPS